jgi:dipeptidyl aminopeptidase/acylaminoacyl peptidase
MESIVTVIIRRRLSFVALFAAFSAPLSGEAPRAGEQASARVLAPVPLEEALRAESASTSELSPDGALVVFLVYESWRRERTGGAYFLPSGQPSGFSGARLYLADTKTGAAVPLADEPAARWSTWAPSWAPDGKSLAFVSNRDGHPRIWRWERQTGRLTRVSDAIIVDPTRRVTHETWRPLQWTPDGRRIVARVLPEGMSLAALAEYSTQRAARVGSEPVASGEPTAIVYPRPAAGAEAKSSRKPGDPGSVFIGRHSHFLGDLAAIDVASGRVKRLASRVHVERYEVSPNGRRLAAYDVEALRIIDIDTGAELASDPVPASVLPRVEVRWAPNSDAVLHLVDGALRIVPVSGEAAAVPNLTLRTLPVWSRSGQAFYALDGQRLLRLNGLAPPDVVATITGGRVVSWLFADNHRSTAAWSGPSARLRRAVTNGLGSRRA